MGGNIKFVEKRFCIRNFDTIETLSSVSGQSLNYETVACRSDLYTTRENNQTCTLEKFSVSNNKLNLRTIELCSACVVLCRKFW